MPLIDDILRILEPPALAIQEGARNLGRSIFGEQPSFIDKLRAAGTRMQGQNPLALDPLTQQLFQELATSFGPLGMAKVFKPGPETLQGLVANLTKAGGKFPARPSLRAAIRDPRTGEIFASGPGEAHPIATVEQILTRRRQSVPGTLEFGFQIPGESPFIPESIALHMQREGTGIVDKLLQSGLGIEEILDALKQGSFLRR